MASRGLAKRASAVSALITSIFTCCTGEATRRTYPALWRRSKVCARRGRFAPGASPISRSPTWKISSVFHTVTAARPIRSSTILPAATSSATCCRGASSTACRLWPIRRSAAPAPACFVIPCLPVSALHIIARQPPWRGICVRRAPAPACGGLPPQKNAAPGFGDSLERHVNSIFVTAVIFRPKQPLRCIGADHKRRPWKQARLFDKGGRSREFDRRPPGELREPLSHCLAGQRRLVDVCDREFESDGLLPEFLGGLRQRHMSF